MSKNTLKRIYYPLSIIIWLIFCYSFFMVRTQIMHKTDMGTVIDAAEDSEEFIAVSQGGNSYLNVMKDGKITSVFCADSYDEKCEIKRVAVSEDAVYALLEEESEDESGDALYQIIKLDKKMHLIGKTGASVLPYTGKISEFSYYNDELYLTQIASSQQDAYLYLIADDSFVSMNSTEDVEADFQLSDVQSVTDTERILALQYHLGEAVLFTNLEGGSNGREEIVASAQKHLNKAYMNFTVRCKRYHQFFLMCLLVLAVGLFFLLASPTLLKHMNTLMYAYLLWEVFLAFLLGIFALRSGEILYSLLVLFLFAVVSLVGFLTLARHIRNIRVIGEAMEQALDYDEVPEKPPYVMLQELNHIWNCVCDMSRLIRRINYQWIDTLQAYYRFAPKGMEQTLGKNAITEIHSGDYVNLRSSVAIVGFHSNKPLEVGQVDSNVIKSGEGNLEAVMQLFSEWQEEKKGQLISSTWDLREMVYLFSQDCKETSQFGIDICRRMHQHIMVVIHRSNLIYGIAGVEKQSLQYMVNAEISEIQQYMADLQTMGVSFAMTEEAFEAEKELPDVRYIGDLKLNCKEQSIGIYQVLDGLTKYERQSYKDTEEIFKTGLKYIKEGDCYLAKTEFAKVLAAHPADGVAKHYLFLCEESLNFENAQDVEFYLNSH